MATKRAFLMEERLGFAGAVVVHLAIAGLFFLPKTAPKPFEIPPRIEVSLATEVSLESTAPNPAQEAPAAFAPELADVPTPPVPETLEAPIPEPVTAPTPPTPAPKPTTRPRATQRPTPAPKPAARPTSAPTPTPKPAVKAGGSRIGSDFLEGSGAAEGSTGTPAIKIGPREQASVQSAIVRQLKPHWSAPSGVDAEKLVTVLSWQLNKDGTLKGRPKVVSQSGINASNRPQADLHAERAIRAVQLAAPFNLPEKFYDAWKRVRGARFDRNL